MMFDEVEKIAEDEAEEILAQAANEAIDAVAESAPDAEPEEIAEAAAEILPEVVAEKTSQLVLLREVNDVTKPVRVAPTRKLGPAVKRLSRFVSRHRLPLGIAGGLAAAGAGTALALRHRAKRKQAADLLFEGMDNMAKQASSDTPALEILHQLIG